MADKKKPADEPSPVFRKVEFGIGTQYTRKGRSLIEDDLSTQQIGPLRPNQYEYYNNREEPPAEGERFNKGGRVKHGTDTCCDQFPHTSKAR